MGGGESLRKLDVDLVCESLEDGFDDADEAGEILVVPELWFDQLQVLLRLDELFHVEKDLLEIIIPRAAYFFKEILQSRLDVGVRVIAAHAHNFNYLSLRFIMSALIISQTVQECKNQIINPP